MFIGKTFNSYLPGNDMIFAKCSSSQYNNRKQANKQYNFFHRKTFKQIKNSIYLIDIELNSVNRVFLNETPSLRLVLMLIGGIITGRYFEVPASLYTVVIGLGIMISLFIISFFIKNEWHRIKAQSIWAYLSVFALGFLVFQLKVSRQNEIIQTFEEKNKTLVLARVNTQPVSKEKTYKVDLQIIRIQDNEKAHYIPHRCIAYFAKDSLTQNLIPGNHVLIEAPLRKFEKPLNPGNVDFAQIYRNRNILSTLYVPAGKWQDADIPIQNFNSFLIRWRLKIRETLNNSLNSENARAILPALLLGQQDGIDKETRSVLTDAGIIHILAVSGLHVGIIYLIFNYLTVFIKNKKYRFYKLAIVLSGVWMFVFLTGVPPSAFRAAIMFSLFAFAKNLNLLSNAYNVVSTSAILILLINPLLLFDAGFQLSYSAVLGIITFQKPVYSSIYLGKNKLIDYAWSISSVSIAATLGTLVFILFNFNRFPTYFVLTNLIAIPAAFFLLVCGIGIIVLQPIPALAILVAKCADFCVESLLSITEKVRYLPAHVIQNIYPDLTQATLLGCLIVVVGVLLKSSKYSFAKISSALTLFILLLLYTLTTRYKQIHDNEIVVFQIKKGRVIAVNSADITTYYIQSEDPKYLNFEISGIAKKFKTNQSDTVYINPNHHFTITAGNSILESKAKSDTLIYKDLKGIQKIRDSKNSYQILQPAAVIKW